MKKVISVFLATILIFSSVSVAAFAEKDDSDLKIAVASDLHYDSPQERLEGSIDDPIYWYSNRRAEMEYEGGFIIDEFLRQCAEDNSCDYVLIAGDIANNGRRLTEDHYTVAEKLRAFEKETGKQVYVINGNHDASENENETSFSQFKEIYYEFGYDEALALGKDDCSYTVNLGDKYRLIALDSCHKTASTEDGITAEKIKWVHSQVTAAKADGRYPILMTHHNILEHMPLQRIISRNFIVKFHNTISEMFADWGIKVILSGHEHGSDVAVYTSALGNKIYDFSTTSLTMYPLAYRMFNFTDNEITYSSKQIQSIDTDALTASIEGYTPEQIALMNEDFAAYSKGFFKAGIKYRLELSLSMDTMGISEDDFYYDIVNTAVGGLTDLLNMPLYGENSVQTLAKQYNIDLPDSEYNNGWDLITEIMAWHYSGEEDKGINSTDIDVFLKTVVFILRTDLANISDEVIFKAANKIFKNLGIDSLSKEFTELYVERFGPVTSVEYLLLAIASPIIETFTYDNDGVNDNNGTIEGYAEIPVEENIQNIKDNSNKKFLDLKFYLTYIINCLLKIFYKFI